MKIYVVSRPNLDFEGINRFLESEGSTWRRSFGSKCSEELIEFAGRICYFSFGRRQSPRSNEEYIRNLIESGHESVLEHSVWTFIVSGISRALSHQLVRHRVGFSFSQLSQQYHDESEAGFVIPKGLEERPDMLREWNLLVTDVKEAYIRIQNSMLRNRKLGEIPKEELRLIRSISRSILPNATETKIAITANTRALRNFIKTRGTTEGDLEMREYSCQLLTVMKNECPAAFYDMAVVECTKDGLPIVCASNNLDTHV
jgi:thymidylate synthase (FAD)